MKSHLVASSYFFFPCKGCPYSIVNNLSVSQNNSNYNNNNEKRKLQILSFFTWIYGPSRIVLKGSNSEQKKTWSISYSADLKLS